MAENELVVVVADVQNLYHAAKTFGGGKKVNYKLLMQKILNGRKGGICKAYAAHKDYKDSKRFYNSLRAAGFEVVSKRIITKVENGRKRLVPRYFEVELATDVMDAAISDENVKTVVLCTGNGSYSYLLERLKELGVNVEVWCFDKATAESLKERSTFHEIPAECLMSAQEAEKVEENASSTGT